MSAQWKAYPIVSPTEEHFQAELVVLAATPTLSVLAQSSLHQALEFLYLYLTADDTPLTLALRTEDSVLRDYFLEITGGQQDLPTNTETLITFLHFCNRASLEAHDLQRLLHILWMIPLDTVQLHRLRQLVTPYVVAFVTVAEEFEATVGTFEPNRLLQLLGDLPALDDDENLATDTALFLRRFPTLFAPLINYLKAQSMPLTQTALWFTHWRNFQQKTEVGIEADDDYYQLEYWEIIRNVPPYIWCKNGVPFYQKQRRFYLGSPEFRFLALGNNVRKLPHLAYFSKRMAALFNDFYTHPEKVDQLHQLTSHHYFFLLALSQKVDTTWGTLLIEYMRYYPDPTALAQEIARWQPVIQKIASFKDSYWLEADEYKRMFLGYMYHCLRDVPNFTLKRKTEQELIRATERYYTLITVRQNERTARAEQRRKEVKIPKAIQWAAHNGIRPLEPRKARKGSTFIAEHTLKIIELTDEHQLNREGQQMRHCVATYAVRCQRKVCSVWSLREFEKGQWRSRVTIEISRDRRIVQARGRFNAVPKERFAKAIENWANREGLQ